MVYAAIFEFDVTEQFTWVDEFFAKEHCKDTVATSNQLKCSNSNYARKISVYLPDTLKMLFLFTPPQVWLEFPWHDILQLPLLSNPCDP